MTASVAAHADGDAGRLNAVKVPEPFMGLVQAAKPQAPTWCKDVKQPGKYGDSMGAAARSIDAGDMIHAAVTICQWPSDPASAHAAQVILQHWMNSNGETQAQAVESITARVDEERFAADGKNLCKALVIPGESEGEEKAFIIAERELMGCGGDPLWDSNGANNVAVFPFLDQSETQPSELVRVASILATQRYIFRPDQVDHWLPTYIINYLDLQALSEAALTKVLATQPYAGNTYARAVAIESFAMAKLAAVAIQREVDTRAAKDPDWKMLLVTAPQAAGKAFTEQADKYKEQLARSNAFEHKFWGPSKKAYAGCWKELHADFQHVLKDQKHATEQELKDSLQNPIVSLLFTRLVACSSVDKDGAYSGRLHSVATDGIRRVRGPRGASYYGAVEAYGQIVADRAKFPVSKDNMRYLNPADDGLLDEAYKRNGESKLDGMGWVGDGGEGTIASAKKGPRGLEIAFVKTKQQMMGRSCTETNRIIMFRNDGSPVYYQNCHDTGLQSINTTPEPIIIPDADWQENLKAGQVMKFSATRKDKGVAWGLPMTVYTDKTKKKLVMWVGIAMP